jgi:YidC/Oxa1 family membrane protein insertase
MALYREHRVNPFSGILFLVIQIPILLALYRIFLRGLTSESFHALYAFVERPAELHTTFLGLLNLAEKSILMVVLAAILQYIQGWLMVRKQPAKNLTPMEQMGRRMVFLGPILTLLIFSSLPAAVSLYWVVSTAVSILQQIVIERHLKPGVSV